MKKQLSILLIILAASLQAQSIDVATLGKGQAFPATARIPSRGNGKKSVVKKTERSINSQQFISR